MVYPLRIFSFFLVLCCANSADAQSFVNGDLDGIVGFTNAPTGWSHIPFTDPVCLASPTAAQATVDIADINGPAAISGIAGTPQSGTTFCTALHASIFVTSLTYWHEGIMQDVSGFAIGATYEISLYQAVVQQANCLDQSGSWRVYLDGLLIGTTAPTASIIAYDDLNLQWENRVVSFTATSASHTIKFIPWDDDLSTETSYTDVTGALRMGIDNISFILPNQNPPSVDLGSDTTLCLGSSMVLDATYPNSTYLWQDSSTNPTFTVSQAGIYWVDVTNLFGTVRDSIVVDYDSTPTVSLNDFTLSCPPEPLLLNAVSNPNVSYLWQDNSTGSNYSVSEPGAYTVTVSNVCGSSSATSTIDMEDCEFVLEMPNVFTPNQDNTNDFFIPIEMNGISELKLIIFNRWGQILYETNDLSPSWDGKFKGNPCTTGVYFWKIEASDFYETSYSFHGNVHLIR